MEYSKHRAVALVACLLGFLTAVVSTGTSSAQRQLDANAAEAVALTHLDDQQLVVGLNQRDVGDLRTTTVIPTSNGGWVVHVQQTVAGIPIDDAHLAVTVDQQGDVIAVTGRAVTGAAKRVPALLPTTTAETANQTAEIALGVVPTASSERLGPEQPAAALEADAGGAEKDIATKLVLVDGASGLQLAWEVVVEAPGGGDVWKFHIDASNGNEISRDELTQADSYRVFDQPTESPNHGGRTLVVDPADPTASPFGWHDTDGIAGADFTTTEGNNVTAYADTDSDQQPDPGRPDGGAGLVFDHQLDLAKEPIDSQAAAITNLFYWANVLHDITYAHGFDEPSGNFQTNNYGNGGLGGDPLRAEAQDGFSTNNATFFTPPDGTPPRLQLYRFTYTSPARDSAYDAGLIAHEYMHGVTQRLTGGPAVVTCLLNEEQPGEGWSDWLALMVTMEPGAVGSAPRGFGTWLLGQPTTGTGLRDVPYSTDLAIDPRTYADIVTASEPHGVGSIFAAMLWDLTWAFVDRDGFSPDLINGSGGNITALQLVFDALKLQPCSPGFVDARDAILTADQAANGGANQCLIWEAFARRGLGFGAVQGSGDDKTDGTEAFDLPPDCTDIALAIAAGPTAPVPGDTVTYTVDVSNTSATPLTGTTVTFPIPSGATYVPGSATCGGTEAAGIVSLPIGSLAATSTTTCTLAVDVDPGPGTWTLAAEDAEAGFGALVPTHGAGTADWVVTAADANGGTQSFLSGAPSATSDQYLTLAGPVGAGPRTELRFAHRYTTENTWDGGVVELSTNGVDWVDAGPLMTSGGYVDRLEMSANPIGGRLAFTGDSGGWIETVVDLSAHAGSDVWLRFRLGTDATMGGPGWFVDDIEVIDPVELVTLVDVDTSEGPNDELLHVTRVEPSSAPGLLRVTTNPAVPAVIDVNGGWTDAFGLDWVETPAGQHTLCYSGVPGFEPPPCETVTVVPNTTTAASANYVVQGTLDITTSPAVVSTITVNGAPVNDWGAIVRIAPGSHEVCFGAVPGWDPPPCTTVAVTAGTTTSVVGTFTANGSAPGPNGFGNLRVTTSPAVPSQIHIDGVGAQSFGLDWVKLAPGDYEVCFSDVPGYATPACETVTVVAGTTTVTSGVFTPLAELRVLTDPPAGQPVTVDGRIVDQYGFWTWAPSGTYTICTAGYICQTVSAPAGTLTTVTLTPS